MPPLSIKTRLDLIKARTELARRLKTDFSGAPLSDIVRAFNDGLGQMTAPTSTSQPNITDPIQIKNESDIDSININDVGAPDIHEEVDRSISPENLMSAANLYACYQYDQLGVFDVVRYIFGEFFHGELRITSENGALALYRYEKRKKERFTKKHRQLIYKRNFNYGTIKGKTGTPINKEFDRLLVNFAKSVAHFYRDQRISEVIRKGATGLEPSFGSLETVKKAGIDLRNSINRYSSGITLLFTMELSAYLTECLEVLRIPEIHNAYNVRNEWELIEKIGEKNLRKIEKASVRGSLAQEGKNIIEWLAGDDVLETDNILFEITLNQVGQWAERWSGARRSMRPAA